jgi:N-acetylglucosamine kinase-like BadF-type ATPase
MRGILRENRHELLGKFPVKTVLAVDGGASKVDVALVDVEGNVLRTVRRRGRFNFGLGSNGSMDGLAGAIRAAQASLPSPPALGVFCLAGADIAIDDRRIASEVGARRWVRRTVVRNDTFAVLRAGTDRKWGVAIVCGTGMNCAGVGPDGSSVRFPSFGELSGDRAHGGGWLGRTALGAAIRARDGRGPRTLLERLVPAHFGMSRPTAVMEAVYVGRLSDERLSELAPVVFRAAADKDAVALAMLEEVSEEIVVTAKAAIRRLHLAGRDVHVVLGGGILRAAGDGMIARITDGIKELAPRAAVLRLDAPPVLGAALIGLDMLRAPAQARRHLREAFARSRAGHRRTG